MLLCGILHAQTTGTCGNYLYTTGNYGHANFGVQSNLVLPNDDVFLGSVNINTGNYAIVKLNGMGDTVWTKTYYLPSPVKYSSQVVKVILDYDGNVLSFCENNFVLKTDTAGNVLYTKRLLPINNNLNFIIQDVFLLANGSKAFLLSGQYNGGVSYILTVVDANLNNILWSTLINPDYVNDIYTLGALGVNGNNIAVSTTFNKSVGTETGVTALTLFNGVSGAIMAQHYYTGIYNFQRISAYNSGYLLTDEYDQTASYYVRTDAMLNVVSASQLNNSSGHFLLTAVNPDGSFIGLDDSRNSFTLFSTTAADSVVWANNTYSITFVVGDIKTNRDGIYFIENGSALDISTNQTFIDPNMIKADNFGNFSSCFTPVVVQVQMLQRGYSVSPAAVGTYIDTSMLAIVTSSGSAQRGVGIGFNMCIRYINCTKLNIGGNNTICGDSAYYVAHKSPDCTLPVVWSVRTQEAAHVTLTTINDTTVLLHFLKSGTYHLMAGINSSCANLADTMAIQANTSTESVTIGPGNTVCPGDTLLLSAGSEFKQYTWQNGSTDSTLPVTTPGKYYVSVIDFCGRTLSDTINVTSTAADNFTLAPDTSKCLADTLILQGFAAYTNIAVMPGINTAIINNTVAIYSPQTQAYTITAYDVHGCKVSGNITVNIYPQPILNLGADTSICSGDSLILNAGAGFASYAWSTGSTSSSIVVKQPGTYAVKTIAANNCVTKDTMVLQQVYSLPIINLDTSSIICSGTPKILYAGSGFVSYAWNTGGTADSLTITTTGTYTVTVTDTNTCTNTQSVTINKVAQPPANFLPADTTFCNYQPLVLNAGSTFKNYLWSNNSNQPSITITTPGVYWLHVTDYNNCTATDSITTAYKHCIEAFYIPAAFTPNGDGRNDVYRPVILGNVVQYTFTVYNRWGNKVFESQTPNRGWDGTYNGAKQNAGAYIWYCVFQLSGAPLEERKGTCVLIR